MFVTGSIAVLLLYIYTQTLGRRFKLLHYFEAKGKNNVLKQAYSFLYLVKLYAKSNIPLFDSSSSHERKPSTAIWPEQN